MKDLKMTVPRFNKLSVRNQWTRGVLSENGARPDHVLLDVGTLRGGYDHEWNSISLTPARARRVAVALLKAAAEAEGTP